MFTMYSSTEQCCHFHFVLSLVSVVNNEFEEGPISFIELLFYAVGLLTFPFILSFHLGSSISNDAEQGPISLLLFFD